MLKARSQMFEFGDEVGPAGRRGGYLIDSIWFSAFELVGETMPPEELLKPSAGHRPVPQYRLGQQGADLLKEWVGLGGPLRHPEHLSFLTVIVILLARSFIARAS